MNQPVKIILLARCIYRNTEEECRALSGNRLDPDPPVMVLNYAFAQGKSYLGAGVFPLAVEPLENTVEMFRLYPDTVIGNGEDPFTSFPLRGDADLRAKNLTY